MSVEILDKSAQATELGFSYEQSPANTRIANLMKAAFPMSDHKQGKLYMRIKSSNAEKLDEAFESFISALMLTLAENQFLGEDFGEVLGNTRIQVGHAGNNCILMVPLDSTHIHQNVHETVESTLSVLNDTGLRVSGSVGLGLTLEGILKQVS